MPFRLVLLVVLASGLSPTACHWVTDYSAGAVDSGVAAVDAPQGVDTSNGGDARADAATPVAFLEIVDLLSGVTEIYPGQRKVVVLVRLRNPSAVPVEISEVRPILGDKAAASESLVSGWEAGAVPSILASSTVAPGNSWMARLWLDIPQDLGAFSASDDGPITLGVEVEWTSTAAGGSVTGPNPPLQWRLIDVYRIVVNSTLGAPTPAEDDDEISLHDAIALANDQPAEREPPVIVFDPGAFPVEGVPASIRLSQRLPRLRRAGTQIDGTGAGVVIAPGLADPPSGSPLGIYAADVTIRGLTLQGFGRATRARCVEMLSAYEGVRLLDNTFDGCAGSARDQVYLRGSGHRVAGNSFVDGLGHGLKLDPGAGGWVVGNQIVGNAQHGLRLSGSDIKVLYNRVVGNGEWGIHAIGEVSAAELRRNYVLDNKDGGLELMDGTHVRVVQNVFHNDRHDVWLGGETSWIDLSPNSFNATLPQPIRIEDRGNGSVPAVALEERTQQNEVSGFARAVVNRVAIYRRTSENERQFYSWVGEVIPRNGAWSLALADAPAGPDDVFVALGVVEQGGANGSTEVRRAAGTLARPPLVVSTAVDEMTGDTQMETPEAAGPELSLREALVIAANRPGPDRVAFSGSAFGPGEGGVIELSLGALPAISDSDTLLDGRGANVVIDGSDVSPTPIAALLSLRRSCRRCGVVGLTLSDFDADDTGACILTEDDMFGLLIADNTLVRCGSAKHGAIWLRGAGSSGLGPVLLANNTIESASHGITVTDPVSATIEDNTFGDVDQAAVTIYWVQAIPEVGEVVRVMGNRAEGSALGIRVDDDRSGGSRIPMRIEGNVIADASQAGIEVITTGSRSGWLLVRGNTVTGCGYGIHLKKVPSTLIEDNQIGQSDKDGLLVESVDGLLELVGNELWGNDWVGAHIHAAGNDVVMLSNSIVGNDVGLDADCGTYAGWLYNNLVAHNLVVGIGASCPAEWQADHNLYDDNDNRSLPANWNEGSGSIQGDDPRLEAWAEGKLAPAKDGPAANAGVDPANLLALPRFDRADLDVPDRAYLGVPDIGAVEVAE